MEWLVGFAGLWVLFQWIIPIALLVGIGVWAMRVAQRRNRGQEATFSSAMPEERHAQERDYQDVYWPLDPEASSDRDAHLHVPGRHDQLR